MDSNNHPTTFTPAFLEECRLKDLPSSAFYIADFISYEEEQFILKKISNAPKPKWKQLSKRRLQTWPSDLNKDTLLDSPLPQWLKEPIIPRILSIPLSMSGGHIFQDSPHAGPNHVLINEYQPNQGIMPHKDGAAYHPVVCTVSLGSTLCLDIYSSNPDETMEQEPRWKILQEPRSLLITAGELYTDYLHGIKETHEETNLNGATVSNWDLLHSVDALSENGQLERKTRTSLTFRDVKKVSSLGAKFSILRGR